MKSEGPMFCALHFQSSVRCTKINFSLLLVFACLRLTDFTIKERPLVV